MINKIYISHWSGGNASRVYDTQLNYYLIKSFVKSIKKQNSIEIILSADDNFINNLDIETKNNLTINNITGLYNKYEAHQWPLVKTLIINSLPNENILHLDYDIIWDYKLDLVLEEINKQNIDVLYQKYESLTASNGYYLYFLNQNPEYKKTLAKISPKIAHNAGITFFNKRAKEELNNILTTIKKDYNHFKEYTAFEQLVIPGEFKFKGYNLKTLGDILKHLSKQQRVKPEDLQIPKEYIKEFNILCKQGVFMPVINFYHIVGDLKNSKRYINMINILSREEIIPQNIISTLIDRELS